MSVFRLKKWVPLKINSNSNNRSKNKGIKKRCKKKCKKGVAKKTSHPACVVKKLWSSECCGVTKVFYIKVPTKAGVANVVE